MPPGTEVHAMDVEEEDTGTTEIPEYSDERRRRSSFLRGKNCLRCSVQPCRAR